MHGLSSYSRLAVGRIPKSSCLAARLAKASSSPSSCHHLHQCHSSLCAGFHTSLHHDLAAYAVPDRVEQELDPRNYGYRVVDPFQARATATSTLNTLGDYEYENGTYYSYDADAAPSLNNYYPNLMAEIFQKSNAPPPVGPITSAASLADDNNNNTTLDEVDMS